MKDIAEYVKGGYHSLKSLKAELPLRLEQLNNVASEERGTFLYESPTTGHCTRHVEEWEDVILQRREIMTFTSVITPDIRGCITW